MESTTSVGESTQSRHSLFDAKDDFIERIAPIGVAAIYFGSFSLSPLALFYLAGLRPSRHEVVSYPSERPRLVSAPGF